jgi:hypothetical protein
MTAGTHRRKGMGVRLGVEGGGGMMLRRGTAARTAGLGILVLTGALVMPHAAPSAMPASTTGLYINAGGPALTDGWGTSWHADSGFVGGRTYTTTAPLRSDVQQQALFQSERYGMTAYRLAVPNGTYTVKLLEAEIWFNAPHQRVFSVSVSGHVVESNVDIYARVGKNAPLWLTFPATVTNGMLELDFSASVNYAKVAGIMVQSGPGSSPTPTAKPSPSATHSPTPPPSGTLIFDDEFNGPAGSQPGAPWSIMGGSMPSRWGVECFVNDRTHIHEDGAGHLVETATYNPEGVPCSNGSGPYESGGIEIPASVWTYEYGNAEARIQVPCASGAGLWPAWWEDGASWPSGGEIDMLEIMKGAGPSYAIQSLHGPGPSGAWNLGNSSGPANWCGGFHTYGAIWSPTEVRFTIDGQVTRTLTPAAMHAGWVWPFQGHPERLLLDLQVGGTGGTVNNATLPQSMVIDWVRVSR